MLQRLSDCHHPIIECPGSSAVALLGGCQLSSNVILSRANERAKIIAALKRTAPKKYSKTLTEEKRSGNPQIPNSKTLTAMLSSLISAYISFNDQIGLVNGVLRQTQHFYITANRSSLTSGCTWRHYRIRRQDPQS